MNAKCNTADSGNTVPVSFRLPPEDKEKLRALAEREHRSLSQQIRHLIHQAHAAGQEAA